MTREGKPLRAAVAVALLAAVLAGCGGSSSDSSSSETTTAPQSPTTAAGGGDEGGQGGSKDQGQEGSRDQGNGSGGDRSQQQGQGGGSGSKNVATPLKVSGGGSGQFQVKGGDNSIQEYGDEGGESELQEVAEIVHGFYVARAKEEWDKACSYLAKSNVQQLEQLVAQSPQPKSGCGPALEAFTRPLPASVEREITTVDAGSFRHEGTQGFLIYYGAGHETFAMPLSEEGGSWKVAALSGTTLS